MKKILKYLIKYKILKQKYYWYEVKYLYRLKGRNIFDWTGRVGLVEKKTVLSMRELKKSQPPLHFKKEVKNLLKNGVFEVEVKCYLGRFENND